MNMKKIIFITFISLVLVACGKSRAEKIEDLANNPSKLHIEDAKCQEKYGNKLSQSEWSDIVDWAKTEINIRKTIEKYKNN